MYFKLKPKVGNHAERGENGRPIVYKSGDVVESDQDLVKLFPNKFGRADEPAEEEEVEDKTEVPTPDEIQERAEDEELEEPVKKKVFKASTPQMFTLEWDTELTRLKGFKKVEKSREEHMAYRLWELSSNYKRVLAVLEYERRDGIIDQFRSASKNK